MLAPLPGLPIAQAAVAVPILPPLVASAAAGVTAASADIEASRPQITHTDTVTARGSDGSVTTDTKVTRPDGSSTDTRTTTGKNPDGSEHITTDQITVPPPRR